MVTHSHPHRTEQKTPPTYCSESLGLSHPGHSTGFWARDTPDCFSGKEGAAVNTRRKRFPVCAEGECSQAVNAGHVHSPSTESVSRLAESGGLWLGGPGRMSATAGRSQSQGKGLCQPWGAGHSEPHIQVVETTFRTSVTLKL